METPQEFQDKNRKRKRQKTEQPCEKEKERYPKLVNINTDND